MPVACPAPERERDRERGTERNDDGTRVEPAEDRAADGRNEVRGQISRERRRVDPSGGADPERPGPAVHRRSDARGSRGGFHLQDCMTIGQLMQSLTAGCGPAPEYPLPSPRFVYSNEMVWPSRLKNPLLTAVESLVAVAAATGAVALLESVADATSLGVVYVLAVMFVAIRRGWIPALATAALSVLALNFFFIAPRHRLTIADDHNVVALGVLLVAGFVVARLASVARDQAAQAATRAEEASAREREATLLAEAASSLLASGGQSSPTITPAL